MNKDINVSIVIPAYNEAEVLSQCLDSVTAELKPGDEIIVVDNNSTDDTPSITGKYSSVKVIPEPRQGQVYAQDTGFEAATNELIARIDADTVVPEGWLDQIRAGFADPSTVAISGPGIPREVRFKKFALLMTRVFIFHTNRVIAGGYMLWGSNCAFRRSSWLAIRAELNMDTSIWEDFDLAMCLSTVGRVDYVSSLVVSYSIRHGDLPPTRVLAYQMGAPRTYWRRGRRLRSLLSALERFGLALLATPAYLLERYILKSS